MCVLVLALVYLSRGRWLRIGLPLLYNGDLRTRVTVCSLTVPMVEVHTYLKGEKNLIVQITWSSIDTGMAHNVVNRERERDDHTHHSTTVVKLVHRD